jgi:hypothetical protein
MEDPKKQTYRVVFFKNGHRIFFADAHGNTLDSSVKSSIEKLKQMSLEWEDMQIYCGSKSILWIGSDIEFNHIGELF